MSEQPIPRLETAIRAELSPVLREDGFSGSGRTFRRTIGSWVQVVNVQGSRLGGSFAINLAVHPLKILDLSGNPPDPKKITETLCEFQRRLCEVGGDYWWMHGDTDKGMLSAMQDAAAMYSRTGRDLFQRAIGQGVGLNMLRAADFANGTYDLGGFGSTVVRMALTLARLRTLDEQIGEAKAFAAYGLAHVGNATSLRRELMELAEQQ